MSVRLRDGAVERRRAAHLRAPSLLRGAPAGAVVPEAPDITARICGICPVAYQTSAVERAGGRFGVEVPEPIRALRRMLYCGEWIESHALHVYMLHAPDFLGFAGAVEMAHEHPDPRSARPPAKKVGNEVCRSGGREIHPVNVRRGRLLPRAAGGEVPTLVGPLEGARRRRSSGALDGRLRLSGARRRLRLLALPDRASTRS